MCTGLEIAAVAASAASSAYSADQQMKAGQAAAGEARRQGQAAMYEAALNKEMADLDAKNVMTASQEEVEVMRRNHMAARGSAMVAQASSGVAMGEGSAQAFLDNMSSLVAADSLATLYSGINKSTSIAAQGQFQYQAGQQALEASGRQAASLIRSGNAAATGTLLSGAANVAAIGAKSSSTSVKDTIYSALRK